MCLHLFVLLFLNVFVFEANGDDECWIGSFTKEICCAGIGGNRACWDDQEYTFERCCLGHNSNLIDGGGEASVDSEASDPSAAKQGVSDGSVIFNDQLPGYSEVIRSGLATHAQLDRDGLADCMVDGSIKVPSLREARREVVDSLRQKGSVPDPTSPLGDLQVDAFFRDYVDLLPRCPQAVLQSSVSTLDRLLSNLRTACSELSTVRACQSNAPFMFDVLIFHVILRHGLIDLYASVEDRSIGNVTTSLVFRGWPIAEHEERVWSSFDALWRTIWQGRDMCSCVEGYDYYATLHSQFEHTLHISRNDFIHRILQPGSVPRRVFDSADHCEEWLDKDFLRLFSSYAKLSACIPGAIMENIVCMHRWILRGQVVGALNTAEMILKLMTLGGACLTETVWPFTKEDIQHNFARLALHWHEANVGCRAMNRFGQRLMTADCPIKVASDSFSRLLWKASPLLEQRSRGGTCTADIRSGACVVDGVVATSARGAWSRDDTHADTAITTSNGRDDFPLTQTIALREVAAEVWALRPSPALETCSETGRNRHVISLLSRPELAALTLKAKAAETTTVAPSSDYSVGRGFRASIGFVLNVPIFSDNVWHNMHWLVPAVARLHADESLLGQVPRDIELLLMFAGYSFTETPPELFAGNSTEDALDTKTSAPGPSPVSEDSVVLLDSWVKPVGPWLQMLSSSPPLLLSLVKLRCYKRIIWGHPEMRADRTLFQNGAIDQRSVQLLRRVVHNFHGVKIDGYARGFWTSTSSESVSPAIAVAFVQRDLGHGRSFTNSDALIAAGLQPLAAKGHIVWRFATRLGTLPLLHQTAIFSKADVMVGAVGAALAWLMVMRVGAQVLEWLPRGVPPPLYSCQENWGAETLGMFGGLARLSGVDHVCLRSEGEVVSFSDKRRWSGVRTSVSDAYWRKGDLQVDPDKFARWIQEAVRRANRTRQLGDAFGP